MTNLYLFKGLNYNNRVIVPNLKTHTDFSNAGYQLMEHVENIDFNINDGVTTKHVLNFNTLALDLGIEEPSYVVAETYFGDADDPAVTCWWVLDAIRTRLGQYELSLLRDVIHDYAPSIMESMCFIEKATCPADSKLIYNKEDYSVNEIKTSEILLKDKTNIPWLVGYIAKGYDAQGSIPSINQQNGISIGRPIGEWEFAQYDYNNKGLGPANRTTYLVNMKTRYQLTNFSVTGEIGSFFDSGNHPIKVTYESYQQSQSTLDLYYSLGLELSGYSISDYGLKCLQGGLDSFDLSPSDATAYISNPNVFSQPKLNELLFYNNKIITDSLGSSYIVRVKFNGSDIVESPIVSGNAFNKLSTYVANCKPKTADLVDTDGITGTPNNKSFAVRTQHALFWVELEAMPSLETTYSIPTNRVRTLDAAYDMFCIPYGEITVQYTENNSSQTVVTNKKVGMAAAQQIQVAGSSNVYDVQLLPYCPVPELISGINVISVTGVNGDPGEGIVSYSMIKGTNTPPESFIFFCQSCNFTFNINEPMTVRERNNPLYIKVLDHCYKYRLASPNYSNYFDFSLAKNDGIDYFNIDCNYKPYSPYIHVNPNFKNLYGSDFNDPRGLVLGGDFSITQVSDAWQDYQIQNKYFQDIFDRQIENLDFNNSINRKREIWSTVGGALSASGTMGIAGGALGPVGAGIGATIGGGISAAAGIADINLNDKLRAEQKKFAEDNFSYQLKTIQALPQTLSKISAFNPNNKIFPVLEIYTCSREEIEAFVNKLCWDGMTIQKIQVFRDVINKDSGFQYLSGPYTFGPTRNFVKGFIIRTGTQTGFTDQLLTNINAELIKGVYWKL